MKLSTFTTKALNYQLLNAVTERNNELEVVFKNDTITLYEFIRLIKRLKSKKYKMINNGTEQLDIFIHKSNVRVSITTMENIQNFCKSNTINPKQVSEKTYKIPYKWDNDTLRELQKYTDQTTITGSVSEDNYNFKINLKKEYTYDNIKDIDDQETQFKVEREEKRFFNTNVFKSENKTYRYKKRYSFVTSDNLFRIDLSVTKQSEQYYYKGRWQNKLFKNFAESNVLNMDPKYEIEIEYIGPKYNKLDLQNKSGEYFYPKSIIYSLKRNLIRQVGSILQVLQNSFYIIDNKEKKLVQETYYEFMKIFYTKKIQRKINLLTDITNILESKQAKKTKQALIQQLAEEYEPIIGDFYNSIKEFSKDESDMMTNLYDKSTDEIQRYKKLINRKKYNRKFYGPKPVTLEINNLDIEDPIHILSDYTVTDKADGSGSMIFVPGFSEFSSLQKQNITENILTNTEKVSSNLLNLIDEKVNFIKGRVYLIDSNMNIMFTGVKINNKDKIYLLNGEWLTENKLNKLMFDYMMYDCYVYNGMDTTYFPLMINENCKNAENDTNSRINYTHKFTELIQKNIPKNTIFKINTKLFDMITEQSNIFSTAENIWNHGSTTYPYRLDGLIFTPANKPVAFVPSKKPFNLRETQISDYDLEFGRTWVRNLKWKPECDNSIDFLIEFQNKTVYQMDYVDKKMYQYNLAYLYCGDNIKGSYRKRRFIPGSPYVKNAYEIYLKLDDKNNTYSLDNMPVQNNTIVECIYNLSDLDREIGHRWSILRTRHDKTFLFRKGIVQKNRYMNILDKFLFNDKVILFILKSYLDSNMNNYIAIEKLITKAETDLERYDYLGILQKIAHMLYNKSSFDLLKAEQNRYKIQNKSQFSEWNYLIVETSKILKRMIKNYIKSSDSFNLYKSDFLLKDILMSLTENKNFNLLVDVYSNFTINIQYGNNYKTANNVWKNIHEPITEEMNFSGKNIMPRQEYYYKTDLSISRDSSLSINIRLFHNFVKGYLYNLVAKYLRQDRETISLLELACGKGQDLFKYNIAEIDNVVAIDISKDNIENEVNGANMRYINLKESGNDYNTNVQFLVGDISKKIQNLDAFNKDTISEQIYYKRAETLFSKKSANYDIVSIQFAMHYMFKDRLKLKNFVENVD